jgi:hypothetical protein
MRRAFPGFIRRNNYIVIAIDLGKQSTARLQVLISLTTLPSALAYRR